MTSWKVYWGVAHDPTLGHVIFFFFSNFNIVGYFFGAFLCVEQMLENTFSSKMPFSHPNFTFKFTKGSAQKYKGKWIDLVFCFLCFKIDRNCWFCSPRSICLLDAVLLIPILLWLMTFYVIWHVSNNAIKWHFMTFYDICNMT